MTMKISPRDWEAISAYLDGQLNPKERSRLEQRLQSNPDLRVALMEMRRTRHLLRSQPRLRAPRNFTLTPEMAGRRAAVPAGARMAPRLYPALRLASAFASLLFVLVLLGDLLTAGARQAAAPVQEPAVAMEAPAQAPQGTPAGKFAGESAEAGQSLPMEAPEAADQSAEVERFLSETVDPTQAAAMTAAPPGAGEDMTMMMQESPTPTPTFTPGTTPTLGEVVGAPSPAPTNSDSGPAIPASTEAPSVELFAAESASQPPTEIAGVPPEQQIEELPPTQADNAYPITAEPVQAPSPWNAWRLAEIGLGSLALLAGLAALYLRLSRRV